MNIVFKLPEPLINGSVSTNKIPAKKMCIHSGTCPCATRIHNPCEHGKPHIPFKLPGSIYRCDQYKRPDLSTRICEQTGVLGAYCK